MSQTVECPACAELLEVDDAHRGWKVRCPRCRQEFVAGGAPPRRDRDEDDEDDDPRPRRRRRNRYDHPDDVDFGRAQRQVDQPGLWLGIVGWGTALLCLAGSVLLAVVGVNQMNNPGQNKGGGDPAGFVILGACLGVFSVPYFAAMGYAGQRMRRLSGWGWALTGAILGMVSFLGFGVCGVFHLGVGIWALIALLDVNVRAAFRFRDEGRAPAPDPWDDDGPVE